MVKEGSIGDASSRILDQLKLMGGFVREAIEKRITVISTGSDQTMNKDRGGTGSEKGAETINVTKMEISRPCYTINMWLE